MFRRLSINKNNGFKAILYKNMREPVGVIQPEFIKEIKYNLNECNEINLEIPNKITNNGQVVINPIYNKFKGKRFIEISFNDEDKERYVINSISTESKKGIKIKKVSCSSLEYILNKREINLTTGMTRQLYRSADEKVEVGEGILNILEEETSWKIGYIDIDAAKDTGLYNEIEEIELYKDLVVNEVKRETLLFEKDVNINIGEQELKFSLSYSGIESKNKNDEIIKDNEKQKHDFDKFAQGIRKIKATYGVNDKYEEVIKYEFILNDGFLVKKEMPFTYLEGMNVRFKYIYLSHQTGNKIENKVTKYRWFEQGARKWLDFLRQDISTAYDCTFQFDTYNKIINCYANKNIGSEDKGLYISYDNYINSISKDEDSDEVVTRCYVKSGNTSIISSNPLGTDYIEDFEYLIKQDNMSDELQNALKRYEILTNKVHEEWYVLRDRKNEKNQRIVYLESKALELNEKRKAQEHLRITYMKQEPKNDLVNRKLEEIKVEIDRIDSEINATMQEMSIVKDEIKELDVKISELNSSIIRENAEDENGKIFTKEDLEELDESIYYYEYQDDFYTTSNGLYENAKIILKEKNKIPINFSVDASNLTNHPRGWKNMIQLGQKATIDDEEIIASTDDGKVTLTSFTYIPATKNKREEIKSIEFSNQMKKVDELGKVGDMGKKTEYTKGMTDFWKSTWNDSSKTTDFVKEMRANGLDTAASVIRSRTTVNEIDINESGMWLKNTDNKDNQLYIGSEMISFTTDGWRSASTAFDSRGLIAEQIIGTALLGEKFTCSNKNNTITLDENGLSVYDELGRLRARLGFYEINGEKKASLLLMSKDGQRVLISEDGISGNDSLMNEQNCDSSHPMYFPVDITDNIKEIRSAKLYLHFSKYRADFKGMAAGGSSHSSSTSSSGGGGTSGAGGGTSATSSSGGGTTSSSNGQHTHLMFISSQIGDAPKSRELQCRNGNGGYAKVLIESDSSTLETHESSGQHTHTINSHTHSLTLNNHTHSIPDHQHNFSFNIDSHEHPISWGIYESTTPSKVAVYVNDVKIQDNIGADAMIDVTEYLKLNQLNKIEITTATNGRINALLSMTTFSSF